MRSRKNPKPAKLRTSITPGTVLILLAGRFRGKRVVFLKQLPSGLLLVTGPRQLNGVPLRRVNQAYVIATSTKVDVSKANVKDINDEFFARAVEKKKKGDNADSFFKAEEKKKELPKERVEKQKAVDAPLLAEIKSKKQTLLPQYLKARFSLSNATPAHLLKF
jgi:large subunit ribosomal protein L6e